MLTTQDLQNLLPEFINHLISTNSSRSTVKNYVSDLRRVLEKLPAETQLDNSHISAALAILKADFSESTIRRFGFSLKAFTNWLASKGFYLNEPPKVKTLGFISRVSFSSPSSVDSKSTVLGGENKVEQVLPPTTVNVSEVIKVSPIENYVEHIKSEGAPETTARQYRADLNSFFSWLKPSGNSLNQKLIDRVSRFDINRYTSFLKSKQVSPASINRYLYSLKDFFNFHKEDIVYETNPVIVTRPGLVNGGHFWQRFKIKKPRWWHAYRGHPMSDYINYAALAAITLFIGLGLFQQFFVQKPKEIDLAQLKSGLVLAATPPRILSFQGRLTNASGTPVIVSTNVVFRIWDHVTNATEVACDAGGDENCMWKSKTWTVIPDSNGIFSVQLGDTGQSDTAIPATLFADNASLYLGIVAGATTGWPGNAETLTPRQRIASSTYALNSDSLDGLDSSQFVHSFESDNFTSGTLTFDSGTTLTSADGSTTNLNSSTIAFGNATGDTITVNGTPTFTTDTNFTLAATENVAMTSDLAGTVDVISIIGTPSASAGTAQGLFIQQAASANAEGLDVGIAIDNADTDLLLSDAISITNTGAFGNGYSNFLNTPTIDITGAGAITGATGLTSSGTITFSSLITDANAVLYTTTGGVVTRVVETETGSQCLLSGVGASGIPTWGACSGGTFSGEVDTTTNGSLTFTSDDASPPAGTVNSIFRDNTGDLNINAVTGKTINLQIAGADEFNFSATGLAFNSNNITGLGTNLTAAAGLTIGTASNGAINLSPNGTGNVVETSGTLTGNAFDLTAASLTTGIAQKISFTSNASGTNTTTGLQINPTLSVANAAGDYTFNTIDLPSATGTGCTGASVTTCRQNSINIAAPLAQAKLTTVALNIADQYSATGTHYGICFDCDGIYSSFQPANGIQWGNDANAVSLYRGFDATGPYLVSTGKVFIPDGAGNGPSLSFANRTNLGLYRATVGGLTNRLGFVANGQPALGIDGDAGVGRFFVGDPAGGTIVSRIQTWDDGGTATSGISLGVTNPVQLFRSANDTLSLGTTTTATAGGALTLSSGGAAGLTLDSADGRVAIATGDFLKTSVSGVTGAAAGDIWYDSAAGKFKINETTGGTKTLCNLTDGGCGGGSLTPWTSDIDADNWSLLDFGPNLTARGALTIASAGAGNDVIINGADILDVQDNATFAGTIDITGLATFTGGITANDASADTFLIGQSGATDDTITIAGDISLTDDQWSISAAGAIVGVGVNSGSGLLQGTGGLTITGAITFSSLITDANAVLYTTTAGVVTRVVETETGSQCLLSGAGASGIPVWGSCGGGGQTPWTGNIDADNFTLTDLGTNITARAGLTIASTTTSAITLDSGTTGNVNIGTGANAKTISIGTAAVANTITIGSSSATGVSITDDNWSITTGGAATFTGLVLGSGTITGAGLTDCDTNNRRLTWDTSTSQFGCSTLETHSFIDSTADGAVDANTTNYWDEAAENGTQHPNITPSSTSTEIFGIVTVEFQQTSGAGDIEFTSRVERNIGSDPTCGSSTNVGGKPGTFTSATGALRSSTVNFMDSPATTSNVVYTLCSDADTIGTSGNVTRIRVTLFELNNTADLAEIYPTNDISLKRGELVSIDPNLYAGVKRTGKAYDKTVMGVVSTDPALAIGGTEGHGKGVPVALSGRVPVKVSTENGEIQPGDLLTASSTPGVAMKATRAGYVIGRAMTEMLGEDNEGMVLAFINTHYADPEKLIELDISSPNENLQLATSSSLLTLDSGNNVVATISSGLKFAWANSAGQIVAWVSDTGEAVFKSVTSALGEFTKIVFGEAVVKKEAKTAGEATFAADATEVFIESGKVMEESLINLTASTKTGGLSLYIKEKRPGEGFVVALERNSGDQPNQATASASTAIKFTWFILNQE